MAAGQGFKTFATGDVLTAADTNGYLMQGVLVFANATARDAAITSPQEGQTCYLKDTDQIYTYSGSAWVSQAGISAGLIDAKGDLIVGSAADTAARLAVGSNDQVLMADSTATNGVKWGSEIPSQTGNSGKYLTTNGTVTSWGSVSSGGMTLLSTTTLSGTTTTISSIDQTYTNLVVVGIDVKPTTGGAIFLRPNNETTYCSYSNLQNATGDYGFDTTWWPQGANTTGNNAGAGFAFTLYRYASADGLKYMNGAFKNRNGSSYTSGICSGVFHKVDAISSFTIGGQNGGTMAGTIYIYGVK